MNNLEALIMDKDKIIKDLIVLYYPKCISDSNQEGSFSPKKTFKEAEKYLKRRQKNILKPDKKQWVIQQISFRRELS